MSAWNSATPDITTLVYVIFGHGEEIDKPIKLKKFPNIIVNDMVESGCKLKIQNKESLLNICDRKFDGLSIINPKKSTPYPATTHFIGSHTNETINDIIITPSFYEKMPFAGLYLCKGNGDFDLQFPITKPSGSKLSTILKMIQTPYDSIPEHNQNTFSIVNIMTCRSREGGKNKSRRTKKRGTKTKKRPYHKREKSPFT
jgi:hypothetical protein